jgi:hypothetical protein
VAAAAQHNIEKVAAQASIHEVAAELGTGRLQRQRSRGSAQPSHVCGDVSLASSMPARSGSRGRPRTSGGRQAGVHGQEEASTGSRGKTGEGASLAARERGRCGRRRDGAPWARLDGVGDGIRGLPPLSGTRIDFSGERGLCFRGELDRAHLRSSISTSLLGRAESSFPYQLGTAQRREPT